MPIFQVEAIQEFITTKDGGKKSFHLASIIAVAVACGKLILAYPLRMKLNLLVTKLGLFAYCYAIRSDSSQVQVLWEDHRNDLLT